MNNLRLLSEMLRAEVNLQLARRRTRAANSRLVRAGRLLAERHCERRLERAKMRLERARREDATLAAAAANLPVYHPNCFCSIVPRSDLHVNGSGKGRKMKTKEMIVELLWSPSLPQHYVAVDDSGSRWLIPVAPIGSASWERRVAYSGNYFLKAVVPDVVRSFYQPAPEAD